MSLLLSSRLQPLRSASRHPQLTFPPQTLTLTEITQVILIFLLRQILHLLGLTSSPISSDSKDEGAIVLPDIRLSMPFLLTEDLLRDYAAAVGVTDHDSILNDSAQTCLMLSAFSEPAMLLLLVSKGCPVRPLGAVNVRNRFELLVPRLCTQEALLGTKNAALNARVLPETRRVKRGLEIDLEVEIINLDEEVVVFRQVFTMLQFMTFKKGSIPALRNEMIERDVDRDWSQVTTSTFEISLTAPLMWARICKDYNPIHISTLAARLLGFSGRIAHGNHALAKGIAGAFFRREDLRKSISSKRDEVVVMEVQFRRPVSLPARLSLQVLENGGETMFRMSKGDRICVTSSAGLSSNQ